MKKTKVKQIIKNLGLSYGAIEDSINRSIKNIEDEGYEVVNIITINKGLFTVCKEN